MPEKPVRHVTCHVGVSSKKLRVSMAEAARFLGWTVAIDRFGSPIMRLELA